MPNVRFPQNRYVFVSLLLFVFADGCCKEGQNPQGVNMENVDDFEKELREEFPTGTPWEAVDDYFRKSGFEYSYSKKNNVFYAAIRNVGSLGFVYETGLLIRVYMNGDKKVKHIEFEFQHEGP